MENNRGDMMNIKGLQKLTLLDYKGYLAATIFTGGCNFQCPFCHNKDLVMNPEHIDNIQEEELFDFLEARQGKLEAVCITGGEPTLHKDLPLFLEKLRSLDYKIKLDTNGTNPEVLQELITNRLVDYVAMDIKNSKPKYSTTCGKATLSLRNIEKSIVYIMQSPCSYEFRTTVARELHTQDDILSICRWIEGAQAYYLQPYRESEQVINPVYSSYSRNELEHIVTLARQYVATCDIIG